MISDWVEVIRTDSFLMIIKDSISVKTTIRRDSEEIGKWIHYKLELKDRLPFSGFMILMIDPLENIHFLKIVGLPDVIDLLQLFMDL